MQGVPVHELLRPRFFPMKVHCLPALTEEQDGSEMSQGQCALQE